MTNPHLINPPPRRQVLADAHLSQMLELLADAGDDHWATDGQSYDTRNKATARAQGHRRLAAERLKLDSVEVTTRVWRDDESGRFLLAIRLQDTPNARELP